MTGNLRTDLLRYGNWFKKAVLVSVTARLLVSITDLRVCIFSRTLCCILLRTELSLLSGLEPHWRPKTSMARWPHPVLHFPLYTQSFFFKYLIPWARLGEPRADTQDPKLGKELWAWLEEQVQGV